MSDHTYTNRLINETSPYLLQHAHNPVDWYPWGEEALAKAKAENKPILLSVGYSACHWCHVMEHESFEDEKTAQLMNEHFVNIKVDREERPDIDSIYMTAVQTMTGHGGWPMTVFMTPEGTPFYGGTYFPPDDRHNIPSFQRVLLGIADAYKTRYDEVVENGTKLQTRIREALNTRLPDGAISPALLDEAYAVLHGQFDPKYGGFGNAPKFPQPMIFEFLLRYAVRTKASLAMEMFEKTLHGMAEGGMYDQLGGGFHRYSVDAEWLVPHFEKMLYDNALLARVYLEAYQATGDSFYRRITEETLDYIVREMRHPDGGFYSTQDADSEGEEGKFFVWTPAELREVLGGDAMVFAQIFDVTERGNFEGHNILRVKRTPTEVARVTGMPLAQVEALVERGKKLLFAYREKRIKPERDEKILTSWNGMALRAFAQAAVALGRDDYRDIARQNAVFLLRELRANGALLRTWKDGKAGTTPAFLEDYALLADGLLALYEATFEAEWLLEARSMTDEMLTRFWDDSITGFYDTASDHETLYVRPRNTDDNATPSGNSVAVDALLRLAIMFDSAIYRERAAAVLNNMAQLMERYPSGFGRYLAAAEFALSIPKEIALIGEPDASEMRALADTIFTPFLPYKVVLLRKPKGDIAIPSPLLEQREQIDGKATAYVCQNYACQLPVTDATALRQQLGVG
ncbi:MAG: thioredoxin domain-containing protein [Chloroflexota bacterium]